MARTHYNDRERTGEQLLLEAKVDPDLVGRLTSALQTLSRVGARGATRYTMVQAGNEADFIDAVIGLVCEPPTHCSDNLTPGWIRFLSDLTGELPSNTFGKRVLVRVVLWGDPEQRVRSSEETKVDGTDGEVAVLVQVEEGRAQGIQTRAVLSLLGNADRPGTPPAPTAPPPKVESNDPWAHVI